MKKMLAVVCGLLLSGGVSFAATINFDDLSGIPAGGLNLSTLPGYGGLNWDHFWVFSPSPGDPSFAGLYNGMVSSPNVAANDYWAPGAISVAQGTTFTLDSAYLTACSFPVVLTVSGSKQDAPVFESTFNLTTDGPTYADFGSKVVDSVIFTVNTPGQTQPQGQIVMDNLTINAVPDGGLTAAMLGMAIFQLALIRTKFQR